MMSADDILTQPNEGDFVSLYCTLGKGMDPFVKAELSQVEQLKILKGIEGKIFYKAPISCANFRPTTVERVLVLIYHGKQQIEPDTTPPLAFDQLHKMLTNKVSWERSVKNWRLLKNEWAEEKLTARLNVKISGSKRKIFKPHRLAGSLNKCLQFRVPTLLFVAKGAQVRIDVHVSDAFVTVGIGLTSGSMQHGLRSTIASAMAMCLTLDSQTLRLFEQPLTTGNIIMDPMCGKGSILNAELLARCVKIGADNDTAQLTVAKTREGASLLLANATNLPVRDNSVDHILCDLPFGLKFSKDSLKTLIPGVIREIVRVLRPEGRAVLLFARNESAFLKELAESSGLQLLKTFDIMLGVLEAEVLVFANKNITKN